MYILKKKKTTNYVEKKREREKERDLKRLKFQNFEIRREHISIGIIIDISFYSICHFLFVVSRYLLSSDFPKKVQILVNNEHTLLFILFPYHYGISFTFKMNKIHFQDFQLNLPSKFTSLRSK